MTELIDHKNASLPALIRASGERAAARFIDFFTSNIRNPNTRRAYAKAVGNFLSRCEPRGVLKLSQIQPLHVASFVEELTQTKSAPTAKQQLSAIRMLFDWRRPFKSKLHSYANKDSSC